MPDLPPERNARFDVLREGSLRPGGRGTCTLVRDGDLVAVVDPGLAPSQASILDPLRALGLEPGDVNAVVLSHHHPDHTVNTALFPDAAVHDHWAVYRGDQWESRECEGLCLSAPPCSCCRRRHPRARASVPPGLRHPALRTSRRT